MEIRQIHTTHISDAAEIIRQSFSTVAREFAITPETCPSHPAYITDEQLLAQISNGLQLFGYYAGSALAGVVGIIPVNKREFSIEKLAVLPEYRHRRIGAKLMIFSCDNILQQGGGKVCIGIIDQNTVLKQWYQQQGFIIKETKSFPHLPFAVCLMEEALARPVVD